MLMMTLIYFNKMNKQIKMKTQTIYNNRTTYNLKNKMVIICFRVIKKTNQKIYLNKVIKKMKIKEMIQIIYFHQINNLINRIQIICLQIINFLKIMNSKKMKITYFNNHPNKTKTKTIYFHRLHNKTIFFNLHNNKQLLLLNSVVKVNKFS